MTAPMGNNGAKRYSYCYDREGKQVGMNVEVVACTSSPTLSAGTSDTNTRFFYDNSKNRVKLITKSGDAYYFVYDPTASIPAVVYEATGTTAYMNTREPSGALIGREKYEDGDLVYSRTYHFDGLGSTIALTDEDGVTTDTYSYDAWGNVTPGQDNQTADNPYQYVGKYGYYTHHQEPTLKLLQLGVRYYDSSVGRFTQIDPIKDGINWYGYAGGNPTYVVDPDGRRFWRILPDSYNNRPLQRCLDGLRRCFARDKRIMDALDAVSLIHWYVSDNPSKDMPKEGGEPVNGEIFPVSPIPPFIHHWRVNLQVGFSCTTVLHELVHFSYGAILYNRPEVDEIAYDYGNNKYYEHYCDFWMDHEIVPLAPCQSGPPTIREIPKK